MDVVACYCLTLCRLANSWLTYFSSFILSSHCCWCSMTNMQLCHLLLLCGCSVCTVAWYKKPLGWPHYLTAIQGHWLIYPHWTVVSTWKQYDRRWAVHLAVGKRGRGHWCWESGDSFLQYKHRLVCLMGVVAARVHPILAVTTPALSASKCHEGAGIPVSLVT